VGNTSLSVYHSFGACVSSYLFALSFEQYLWFICYYDVYATMFYVLCSMCALWNFMLVELCITLFLCEFTVCVGDGYGIWFLVIIIFGIPY
jgi:hypothetical protein